MKVFVTGGSGHIGRAVVETLVRRDVEFTAPARGDASARTLTGLGATPARIRRSRTGSAPPAGPGARDASGAAPGCGRR
jgi:uncharacterized protein YbjT (DUF2867 family)